MLLDIIWKNLHIIEIFNCGFSWYFMYSSWIKVEWISKGVERPKRPRRRKLEVALTDNTPNIRSWTQLSTKISFLFPLPIPHGEDPDFFPVFLRNSASLYFPPWNQAHQHRSELQPPPAAANRPRCSLRCDCSESWELALHNCWCCRCPDGLGYCCRPEERRMVRIYLGRHGSCAQGKWSFTSRLGRVC